MPPVPPQGKQRSGRSNIAVPLHVLGESRAFLFPPLVFLTVPFQRPSPRVLAALGVAVLSTVYPLRPVPAQPSPKIARATRVTRAPRIDGRLDDAMWTAVKPLDDLVQRQPLEGAAPTERSEIYIAYDDEALYIGARLHRVRPQEISRTFTRRDGFGNAERLNIIIDTQRDRRTAVGFGISAAGVRSDFRHTQDEEMRGRESQFDPVWNASAEVDSAGWSAEMRIPFSQLRFPPDEEQRWGFQIDRWMPDKNETVQWALVRPRETGYISRFGTLEGISDVRSTRPVEFLPYLAGDATRAASTTVSNPLTKPYASRVGMDAKVGVGKFLTLDATVNPDFGQVEADPAEVNLTGFETFFDERRPFFVEGSEMVRGNGAQYFYPRRIGAPPRGSASGDFVDRPRASTILGATKLTGRLPSRLAVGGVAAVTAAEQARVFYVDSNVTSRVAIEPRTAFGVLRLQQDIGRQASTIGAAFTMVQRDFAGESSLSGLLPHGSYFGGVDWRLRFQQGKYAISGFVATSYVEGDTAAIRRQQQANAHLFQRPDRQRVIFDPTKRSLSGYSAQLRADKDAGRWILWGAEVKAESPGYEINDLGRLQSTDDIEYNADLQVRQTLPGRYLQNWRLGFETRGAWNFEGAHQLNTWTQNSSVTLKNFWNINVRSTIQLAAIDDALTRGGPYMGTPREFKQEFRINNNFGAKTGWRVNAGWEADEFGATRYNGGGQLTLRPTPRLTVSAEPTYQTGMEPRQYVTRVAGGTRTYGNRYVFAFVDRTTISTRLRANLGFSPNLTLEGYAEPFVASGTYSRIGELAAARSRELREYGTDGTTITRDSAGTHTITDGASRFTISNRDFHVLSFRSNVVMRWEWTPGSTVFVVWQQNRRSDLLFGDPARTSELLRTTRVAGDNFLSVKFTYWLPVRFGR